MPSVTQIREWHLKAVSRGPRHTGNAAHRAHVDWLESELKASGLKVSRDTHQFDRWEARSWSLTVHDGRPRKIPVASYYPYSGTTGSHGVSGELVYVGAGAGGVFTELAGKDLTGKVAVFDIPTPHGVTWAPFFASSWYLHDPEGTVTPATEAALGPAAGMLVATPVTALQLAGAVGAVGIFDVSPEMAAGTYAPFLHAYQDLPTLWLDRKQGALLKERAMAGGVSARLVLEATREAEAPTDHLIAVLPGQTDEIILVNTHSDGPNAIEENGTLGLLALAKNFAAAPRASRQRTLVFFFRTGHFAPAGSLPGPSEWLTRHPEILTKAVTAVTVEHLATDEWIDTAQGYEETGLGDVVISYVSESPALVSTVIDAVRRHDLRRTFILRQLTIGSEGAEPRYVAGLPTFFWIAGPSYLFSWAENQRVDKIDPVRFRRTVKMFASVIEQIDALPAPVLGRPPAVPGVAASRSNAIPESVRRLIGGTP